ncbi:MAG: prolyl oligopeptidase family serine peptidase [Flavobacteriaceae bacterium]|nr:prolyl oligopeptidase family serine peptidase [Flavobacteriaceae bacterium]
MKNIIITLFIATSILLNAQEELGYQVPKKELLNLIDVDLAPTVLRNSKNTVMLLLSRSTYKSIADLSRQELRIAGLRVDPERFIGSRTIYYNKVELIDFEKGEHPLIVEGLPNNPQLTNFIWSPDEKKIAMTHTSDSGVELWTVDVASRKAKKLSSEPINATMGSSISWLKNGKELLVKLLPKDREEIIDQSVIVPTGPKVTENNGEKAQNRTYQDLIKNPTDAKNFTQLSRSEIYRIDMDGNKSPFLDAKMYRSVNVSPNGKYIMVSFVKKPFSYLVPYFRFPTETHVYDLEANLVKVISDNPLQEVLPKGFMAVSINKRNIGWRFDQPSTIYYVKALDKGDPEMKVPFRDALYEWEAPFNQNPSLLTKTINRYAGVIWGNDLYAIIYDRWWNSRNSKTYLFSPSKPNIPAKVIDDRNYQDRYSDPGDFVTQKGKYGKKILALEGNKAFLLGDGFSEKGQFPFLDRIDLKSDKKVRIYESTYTEKYEQLYDYNFIDKKLSVRIESKSEYPNYFIRSLGDKNSLTQQTFFENPFKNLKNVGKELISYKREDGLNLSGILYTPEGFNKDDPEQLPMILWAYPREYKDKSSAAQKTNNPNRFLYPSWGSPIYWVTQGYVVLDRAAFPIIGEGTDEPNDSFRTQLVANAEAAIKAVVNKGYADRNRIAVGGHSYGAFMVANLLSHSNLFAAGIARSGAYNRTLTPFGFQSESRSYWEAPDVYYTMSPFMHADKMKTPLLLVHGEADNNSGTYPLQSERYYNALKGLGAKTRLVMFPKESHGYRAKETILHLIWEQDQWLEKYVKNRKPFLKLTKEKPKG